MSSYNETGNCAPLTIGFADLITTLVNLALFVYWVVQIQSIDKCPPLQLALIKLDGSCNGLAILLALLLICSGVTIKSLQICRAICIIWIAFRLVWLISMVVELVYANWWKSTTQLITAIIYMVIWTIYLGVMMNHTFSLSSDIRREKIHELARQVILQRQLKSNKVEQQSEINPPQIERKESQSYNKQACPKQAWNTGEA